MKNKIFLTLLMFNGGLSYAVQGITTSSMFSNWKQGHFVLQAGGFWTEQGTTQHVNMEDMIGDEFVVAKHTKSNGLIGLGYYFNGPNFNRAQLSYGINAFYLPKTSVSGVVVQENLFSNLSYSYVTTSYPIFAMAKASSKLPMDRLSLMVDAGMGPNFLKTNIFFENPLDGITIPDNAFAGNSNTTFSATVGAGLQISDVFGTMPLECGYRFFYLGKGQLKKINEQIVNNLNTGPIYANAVVCAVKMI